MKTTTRNRFRPALETLEGRSLAAAHLTATLSAGTLFVEGTNHADRITVRQIGGQISVDNAGVRVGGRVVVSVAADTVEKIQVRGLDGDDVINLNSGALPTQEAITVPALVFAGNGNDYVFGTADDDQI